MKSRSHVLKYTQLGVSAVEFALVAAILIITLFGIIEFGRLFFTINGVQEITRRAAREQVVNWVMTADQNAVKCHAVLRPTGCGTEANFPGSPDVERRHVQLGFYNTYNDALNQTNAIGYGSGSLPTANLNNCLLDNSNCIKYVRATLTQNGSRVPFEFIALFGFGPGLVPFGIVPIEQDFFLPYSTVIMPAEALGLL